jgi:hypothetical protein
LNMSSYVLSVATNGVATATIAYKAWKVTLIRPPAFMTDP